MIISCRGDERLAAALKHLADAERRTVSNYVEGLLLQHVKERGVDLASIDIPERRTRKPQKKPAKGGRGK